MISPDDGRRWGAGANTEHRRKRRLGQFFTPVEVARFALQLLERLGGAPGEGATVVDPAAGEGVFLQAAMELWPSRTLRCVGVELDDAAVIPGASVVHGHGLLDPAASFDLALGNPPYGGEGLSELAALADARAVPCERTWRLARAVLQESELYRRFSRRPVPVPAADLAAERLTPAVCRAAGRAARFPIEVLFVERFVRLVKPGGWVAVVLPEGILANARWAFVRAWLAEQGRMAAAVGLPRVFMRSGAAARTVLLLFQRGVAFKEPVLLADAGAEWTPGWSGEVAAWFDAVLDSVGLKTAHTAASVGPFRPHTAPVSVFVAPARLSGERWDPQFWDPRLGDPLGDIAHRELDRLGDAIAHITYGPIVTRRFPRDFPGDVPIVSQPQFEESGLCLAGVERVAEGCVFDPQRSRARRGDLLMPRSGVGSLGRNRLAVYDEPHEANVGCFVNVIRLQGLNPYYAWLFLRTRFGWGQIRRIIHGVGMPNISFDEIRSLRIPRLSADEQSLVENAYRRDVLPLHERGDDGAAAAFLSVVSRLEAALAAPGLVTL